MPNPLLALLLLLAIAIPGSGSEVDAAAIAAKIQILGLEDDALAYADKPDIWLFAHLDQTGPLLIKGLDDTEPRIASGCLALLLKSPLKHRLVDDLLRIAGDGRHVINRPATEALCQFADDPRVRPLLLVALGDPQRFPDPIMRAHMAVAVGDKEQAVGLIVPAIRSSRSDWNAGELIRYLGELGHPSAIGPLQDLAGDGRWDLAVEARFALARIDPQGHPLSADQRTFLAESRSWGKMDLDHRLAELRKLAGLDRTAIRPLVLANLASDRPEGGLVILAEWKDRDALPDILRLMQQRGGNYVSRPFAIAYLEIEGGEASQAEVIALMRGSRFALQELLREVSRSRLPKERKLAFFRAVRASATDITPGDIAESIWGRDDNAVFLLSGMIGDERDLLALGRYAKLAAADPQRRFGAEALLALKKTAAVLTTSSSDIYALGLVLDACADYALPEAGGLIAPLLQSPIPRIRTAAAHAFALCGGDRTQALALLHRALVSDDAEIRGQAAAYLLATPCRDEAERAIREQAVLACLGTPAEGSSLRVLITCCSAQGTSRLVPLLDGDDVARAVHAAWILGQGPDAAIQTSALRRLAINAMFHHQSYQAGEGVDFRIAPGLFFHQVTFAFNRDYYKQEEPSPHIPPALLQEPLSLDPAEQAFSVRAYRHAVFAAPTNEYEAASFYPFLGTRAKLDPSLAPLLRVIAVEDPQVIGLHVAGKLVAQVAVRQLAAQALALSTGGATTYRGLDGAELDSAAIPREPYPEQDHLLARFAVDLLAALPSTGTSRSDDDSALVGSRNAMLRQWVEKFGDALKAEILREVERRGLGQRMREAGLDYWRR